MRVGVKQSEHVMAKWKRRVEPDRICRVLHPSCRVQTVPGSGNRQISTRVARIVLNLLLKLGNRFLGLMGEKQIPAIRVVKIGKLGRLCNQAGVYLLAPVEVLLRSQNFCPARPENDLSLLRSRWQVLWSNGQHGHAQCHGQLIILYSIAGKKRESTLRTA